ncbi:MAG TPA: DUF4350 domain-containing protein [Geobacter sp.]|nr:DUF4350 domain-containing protein [Geobacter sp.]
MTGISKLMSILVLASLTLVAQVQAAQKVVFDTGHGERFVVGEKGPLQLSGLAEILQGQGIQVETVDQPFSEASLAGADALVISGAFQRLHPAEIDAVLRFVQNGGKLAIMLHIAPPLGPLLDRMMISYTNGVIQERQNVIDNDPQRFKVNRLGSHPVLAGLQEFSLHGVWGLINRDESTRIIASSSPEAWIDIDRDKIRKKEATASFGVVVAGELGKGGFLVFGDDAIFQNKFLDENNAQLATNLANWLK